MTWAGRRFQTGAVPAQAGPIPEQLDCGLEVERRHPPDLFPVQTQCRSARRQHPERRATVEQPADEQRDASKQVFAVVQHHESARGGQLLDESILGRSVKLVVHPESSRHGGCHQTPVPDRRELDEAHPRRIPVREPEAHFQTQPRLAAAWRPYQRDQADVIDSAHQFAGIRLTADEPGQRTRTTTLAGHHFDMLASNFYKATTDLE